MDGCQDIQVFHFHFHKLNNKILYILCQIQNKNRKFDMYNFKGFVETRK